MFTYLILARSILCHINICPDLITSLLDPRLVDTGSALIRSGAYDPTKLLTGTFLLQKNKKEYCKCNKKQKMFEVEIW